MNNSNYFFLAPFAFLYGLGVGVRNLLYEKGLLHSHHVSIPTICVGNLAVGGTGKTPHVEWLVRFLCDRYQVAVLSRGYKRKTHGFYLADSTSTAYHLGDECMQLHRKFPQLVVAVCESRVYGAKMIQRHCPSVQVIILDDAFQHRSLSCGFSLLLTAADRLYVHDHFLPWGTLRDSKNESLRANAIVVTKCPPSMTPIERRTIIHELKLPAYQQLLFSSVEYKPWSKEVGALPASARVLVLAGIAHPEYMMEYIHKRFPNAELLAYPDHHAFTLEDLARMEEKSKDCNLVVTTEKDMARLEMCELSQSLRRKLYPLEITIRFVEDESLKHLINTYLSKVCR